MNRNQSLLLVLGLAVCALLLAGTLLAQPAAAAPAPQQDSTPTSTPEATPTPSDTGTEAPTANPPQIVLEADNVSVDAGDCTAVSWAVAYVDSFTLNGLPMARNPGTAQVCPDQTITYTLAALAGGQEITRQVTVNVTQTAEATPAPTQVPNVFPSAKLNDWEPEYSTAGTKLNLIELSRGRGKASTGIFYQLVAEGLDPTQPYELWAYGLAQGKPTPLGPVEVKPDGTVAIGGLGLGGFTKGEPFRAAIASADHKTVVYGKVIPFPIEAQGLGGCSLSVELIMADHMSFWINGDGFLPYERLISTSRSVDEEFSTNKIADAEGAFSLVMLPAVIGHESGAARYMLTGGACEVSVDYEWGPDSKRAE